MKYIKDFKLYESVTNEKYFYLLLDRSHYESFDKRVKKLSTPNTVYILKVNNDVVTSISTELYQPSRFRKLMNIERDLSHVQRDPMKMTQVDTMIKFAKRSAGCICKEYDTLQELKASLEIERHTTNFLELKDAHSDIDDFIKTLRPSAMTDRKVSYRNHLLINKGDYSGYRYMIINDKNDADFTFQKHYDGEIKHEAEINRYYSAYSFLTRSNYYGSTNKDYSLYNINKAQQTQLKNLVIAARELYVDFSKQINDTLRNPK